MRPRRSTSKSKSSDSSADKSDKSDKDKAAAKGSKSGDITKFLVKKDDKEKESEKRESPRKSARGRESPVKSGKDSSSKSKESPSKRSSSPAKKGATPASPSKSPTKTPSSSSSSSSPRKSGRRGRGEKDEKKDEEKEEKKEDAKKAKKDDKKDDDKMPSKDQLEDAIDIIVQEARIKVEDGKEGGVSKPAEDPLKKDDEEKVEKKPPPSAAGLSTVIELGKGTEGKCGQCAGCKRDVCRECSACKRGNFEGCIDTYCSEEEAGRAQRAAMKDLYLKTLAEGKRPKEDVVVLGVTNRLAQQRQQQEQRLSSGVGKTAPGSAGSPASATGKATKRKSLDVKDSDDEDTDSDWEEDQVTRSSTLFTSSKLMRSYFQENKSKPQTPGSGKKVRNTNYVYGSGKGSSKARRCGECEGCMRDDCGTCLACLDKPKFGGKGTKKRACAQRECLMKALIRQKR